MAEQAEMLRRTPLSRDWILRAAVALADEAGIESLSMRSLAQDLGVVPMALYKHVANKDELLDGMIDVVVSEIDPPVPDADWKHTIHRRILSARQVLRRHPWAPLAIESRNMATPAILAYLDSMVGTFRAGGLSADLAHHVMHAMGSRILGFSQETPPGAPAGPARPTPTRRRPYHRRSPPGSRTSRRSPWRHPTTTSRSWGRAATTSSSSSSRWTCCWMASNGCTSKVGHRRADPGETTSTKHHSRPVTACADG